MIKRYKKIATIQAEQFDESQKMIDEQDIIPAQDKNSEDEYWQLCTRAYKIDGRPFGFNQKGE